MGKWYTAWVWSDELGDWRKLKSKRPWQRRASTHYSAKRASELVRKRKRRGIPATARKSSKGKPDRPPKGKQFKSLEQKKWSLINQWLSGDLDAKVDLMYAIAQVAREIRTPLYIAEGKRSVADQWKYWWAYKRGQGPLAAFPGTSNHTHGDAADVRRDAARGTPNIGDLPGARVAMAKWGLCLPVPGEAWHVEFGTNWRG